MVVSCSCCRSWSFNFRILRKMRGALLLLPALVSAAAGQPLGCWTDHQCGDGYCDTVTKTCKKCLLCKDFNRSPPKAPVACINTVSQCGACFEGLVDPPSGDVQEPCAAGGGAPALAWLVAGGVLLLAALAATLYVYYVLRKKHSLNIFASASAEVSQRAPPSAPEAPPPYTPAYSSVRAGSPKPAHNEDPERPFLKRAPPAGAAREAAARQAANVFNNPHYVRGPHPKYDAEPEPQPEPAALADEDTLESPWTPAAERRAPDDAPEESRSEAGAGAGAGALAAALAAARGAVLLRAPADAAPPAKQPRLHQDSNNNGGARERRGDEAGAPAFNILVNVQQINDVKL